MRTRSAPAAKRSLSSSSGRGKRVATSTSAWRTPCWALALKAASAELKQKILGAMSQRAVAALNEEMEFMGPVKMRDVEGAQTAIVTQVRRLEETGEIVLSAGGDDVLL